MRQQVFISYSSSDSAVAEAAAEALERRDVHCTVARREGRLKLVLMTSNVAAITKASLLVLIYTQHANRSEHVLHELETALEEEIPTVALRLSDAEPVPAMKRLLRTVSWLETSASSLDERLEELAAAVARRLDRPAESPTKIFVGNLAFDVNADDLKEAFSTYGSVADVNIVTDRDSGRPRGFAIVEMDDGEEAVAAARALDGELLGGRNLNVRRAPPRPRPLDHSSEGGSEHQATHRGSKGHPEEESYEVASEDETAEPSRRERRHLQARVEAAGRGPSHPVATLRPDRDYRACAFIGRPRAEWLKLAAPLDEPPPEPDGRPVRLRVLFWEPTACPQPRVSELDLWPEADTGVCVFPFRTAAEPGVFAARFAVYYRNRNLQTGVLRGLVGDGSSELSFTPDAAPLPRFAGLEGRAEVDASIILNDDPGGRMQAFVFRQGEAAVAEVGDAASIDVSPGQERSLEQLTTTLGRQITRITSKPEDYDHLGREGTRQLLVELATRGGTLLKRLRKHTMMRDALDGAGYVQIVRAHPDAFFPVEFLYAGKIPEDEAALCDGDPAAGAARAALASGTCCGAYGRDPENTVCPLRFWSLSKVIERHAHLPEHSRISGKYQLRSAAPSGRGNVLDPLKGAVLGASSRVDKKDADTVATLRERLGSLVRTAVPLAESWRTWAENIEQRAPHLLVLLPHHEYQGGDDVLEIGGDLRASTRIRERHVRPPDHDALHPIVLLIGCGTNSAKINLESCVTAFQDEGAAIVVSTIGSILGRQAGPAAAAIVEELAAAARRPGAVFGEAMLAARRRLLGEGMPMVLGLTSYGDADWRIAHAPPSRRTMFRGET